MYALMSLGMKWHRWLVITSCAFALFEQQEMARAGDAADVRIETLRQTRESLDEARRACGGAVRSTVELRHALTACEQLQRLSGEVDQLGQDWRRDAGLSSESRRDLEYLSLVATAAAERARLRRKEIVDQLPLVPLGSSDLSLSVHAFVGLLRVHFGGEGEGDRIQALSGVGTGGKLRWDGYASDGRRFEIVGLNVGLFFEPIASAAKGSVDGRLSAVAVLSSYEHFYVGAGWTFASSEPGFRRGFERENLVLVIGLGADGKALN